MTGAADLPSRGNHLRLNFSLDCSDESFSDLSPVLLLRLNRVVGLASGLDSFDVSRYSWKVNTESAEDSEPVTELR